ARVAIECDDSEAFKHNYDRCWEHYGGGAAPQLNARLEKLITAARRRKLAGAAQHEEQTLAAVSPEHVRSELARAHGQPERAGRALALLLEATGAVAGHLYGIRAADIERLASHAAAEPGARLEEMLRRFLRAESDEDRTLAVDEIANM